MAALWCPYGGLAVCSTPCGQRKAHARLPYARRTPSGRPPWQSAPCVEEVYILGFFPMSIIIHIRYKDCRQSYTQMALVVPQQLRRGYLRMQLRRVHRERDVLIAALILEEQRRVRQQRKRRTMWVKPWLLRRVPLGHYDNLMQELMRESRGDFKAFLRMEPAMFQEMLVRVAPRITKKASVPGPPLRQA